MKASIKKYDKYLVQSKTLPIFAVPRSAKFNRQAEHIFYTADKAGFLRQVYSIGLADLGGFQGRLALIVLYVTRTFFSKCQDLKKLAQAHQVRPMLRLTPVTALNPFYPFLTKKSFFAFNPLHRTSCVLSSQYFVQPCMSLQCDNQNGCMKTVFRNISEKCLQSQKFCVCLPLPRAHYIVVSKNIFQKSCNKASLSCGTSLTGSEFLAELQGRLALSVLDITQNFIPCQELMKLAQAHQVRPMLRLTPVTALNPFYPFLTKKSFFAFNPLHRTSCVLSSQYFVQPCMSLQCDNQNGCMKTVFRNISEKCLQSQKFCVCLSLPRRLKSSSSKNIQITADKAGFLFGRFYFGGFGVLADFQKGPALLLYTISNFSFPKCQDAMKNLQPAHQVRPLQRKSVRKSLNLSLIFLTRKSSIVSNLFQRVRSAISLRCSVSFSVCS